MAKYEARAKVTTIEVYHVEADSLEAAREKAELGEWEFMGAIDNNLSTEIIEVKPCK